MLVQEAWIGRLIYTKGDIPGTNRAVHSLGRITGVRPGSEDSVWIIRDVLLEQETVGVEEVTWEKAILKRRTGDDDITNSTFGPFKHPCGADPTVEMDFSDPEFPSSFKAIVFAIDAEMPDGVQGRFE